MAGLTLFLSKTIRSITGLFLLLLLSACSTIGYQTQTATTIQMLQQGRPLDGIPLLDQNRQGDGEKDLLYLLEKGELLRQGGQHAASALTWGKAENLLQQWDERAKLQAGKLLREATAFLLNDTTRNYEGRDYEKTLLNLRLAMAFVAQGEWENARVEIRRMHEREAVIAELREKEVDAAKKEAQDKGVLLSSFRELNGYPVETLETPEVLALKNAYESAIGNYFAGFVYEALKEPSLAAAGYRKAIELSGKKLPALDKSLEGLDARVKQGTGNTAEVLLILETGQAPTIVSRDFAMPVPVNTGRGRYRGPSLVWIPMSWPIIPAQPRASLPSTVMLGNAALAMMPLTHVDAMARRALRDEMPQIILRTSVRAATKAALQVAGQDRNNGNVGALLGFVAAVGGILTEHADERLWRTLPNTFSVGRINLPAGEHVLQVETPWGRVAQPVSIKPGYAVIDVRLSDRASFVSVSPSIGGGNEAQPAQDPDMMNKEQDETVSPRQTTQKMSKPASGVRPIRRLSDQLAAPKEKP